MEYHDFASPTVRERHADTLESVKKRKSALPVVTIDGEIKMEGYVSFWDIVEALEASQAS